MSQAATDVRPPVVVVGAGPVGLCCAVILARLGVPVVVLERRTSRSTIPRAHVINPRSLEILRAFDVDEAALEGAATSRADDHTIVFMERLSTRELGQTPFERHDDTHTPTPRLNIAQPKFERILLDELQHESLVEIRTGHRVTGVDVRERGATLTVHNDDIVYQLDAEVVVACDGANSDIRSMLGMEMSGDDAIQRCLTVHFEANLRELVVDRPGMMYWAVAAQPPGIFLAYDIERTWVYLSFMAPEETPGAEEAAAIVADALGTEADISVQHVVPWTLSGQVAEAYRSGGVFLAGDSAHRFPPSGGLGLNTGIQDVHNLAWKVAAVRAGWASPELLDTYESERRPIAQMNTQQSVDNSMAAMAVFGLGENAPQDCVDSAVKGMFDNFNSLGIQLGFSYGPDIGAPAEVPVYVPRADVGDRLPHTWCQVGGVRTSVLDLLDPRSFTLLHRGEPEQWANLATGGVPIRIVDLASAKVPSWWTDLVGLDGSSAVLVRPDGHVAAVASDANAGVKHLRQVLKRHLQGVPLAALSAGDPQ